MEKEFAELGYHSIRYFPALLRKLPSASKMISTVAQIGSCANRLRLGVR